MTIQFTTQSFPILNEILSPPMPDTFLFCGWVGWGYIFLESDDKDILCIFGNKKKPQTHTPIPLPGITVLTWKLRLRCRSMHLDKSYSCPLTCFSIMITLFQIKERAVKGAVKLFKFVTAFTSNFCKERKIQLLNLTFKYSLRSFPSPKYFPHFSYPSQK